MVKGSLCMQMQLLWCRAERRLHLGWLDGDYVITKWPGCGCTGPVVQYVCGVAGVKAEVCSQEWAAE